MNAPAVLQIPDGRRLQREGETGRVHRPHRGTLDRGVRHRLRPVQGGEGRGSRDPFGNPVAAAQCRSDRACAAPARRAAVPCHRRLPSADRSRAGALHRLVARPAGAGAGDQGARRQLPRRRCDGGGHAPCAGTAGHHRRRRAPPDDLQRASGRSRTPVAGPRAHRARQGGGQAGPGGEGDARDLRGRLRPHRRAGRRAERRGLGLLRPAEDGRPLGRAGSSSPSPPPVPSRAGWCSIPAMST